MTTPSQSNVTSSIDTCYFFGTFNPVHMAHLMIAQLALVQYGKALGFNSITFVPAGHPPHRMEQPDLLPSAHRYKMVELAIADNPRFHISDVEQGVNGPTYTVASLRRLHPNLEADTLRIPMIIGSDAFLGLGKWDEASVLVNHALFLQAGRPECVFEETVAIGDQTHQTNTERINLPEIAISSTWIRQQILNRKTQADNPLRYILPKPVLAYFEEEALYDNWLIKS